MDDICKDWWLKERISDNRKDGKKYEGWGVMGRTGVAGRIDESRKGGRDDVMGASISNVERQRSIKGVGG